MIPLKICSFFHSDTSTLSLLLPPSPINMDASSSSFMYTYSLLGFNQILKLHLISSNFLPSPLTMDVSKPLLISLLISLFLLHIVQADDPTESNVSKFGNSGFPKKIDCGGACAARCTLSSRPNLCKRACGTCCARCNCVPPGTYGNLETCPCYARLTTRGNRRKCP